MDNQQQVTKSDWYKGSLGILLILVLWPFALTYWIWKRNWDIKIKVGIISLFWLIVISKSVFPFWQVQNQSKEIKSPIDIKNSDAFIPTSIPTSTIQPTQTPSSTNLISPYPTKVTKDFIVINILKRLDKNNNSYDDIYAVTNSTSEIAEDQLKFLAIKIKNSECSVSCSITLYSSVESAALAVEYDQLITDEDRKKWEQNHPGYFSSNTLLGTYNSDDNTYIYLVNPIEKPTEIPESTLAPTLEDKVKNIFSGYKIEQLTVLPAGDLITNEDILGKIQVDVFIDDKEDAFYWDTNSMKKSWWIKSIDFFKKIFPLDDTINHVHIVINVPVTDAYGKETYTVLEAITWTRKTFDRINWSNFDVNNVPVISDVYMENKKLK